MASSKLTIKNETTETWYQTENTLSSGDWDGDDQPPEKIDPKSSVIIKATGKWGSGPEYKIYYSDYKQQELSIVFNVPNLGSNVFTCVISHGRYEADMQGNYSGWNPSLSVSIKKPG